MVAQSSLTSMGVGFVGAGFGFITGDFVGLRDVGCDVEVDTGGAAQQSRVNEYRKSAAHHQCGSERYRQMMTREK